MPTLVEALIPLFADPNTPEAFSHENLCATIREFTLNDTAGEIDLTEEIRHARGRFNDLYQDGQFSPAAADDMRMLREIAKALSTVRTEQREARAKLDNEFSEATQVFAEADAPATPEANEDGPGDSPEAEDTPDDPEGSEGTNDAPERVPALSASSTPPPVAVRPSTTPVVLPKASSLNGFRNPSGPNSGPGGAHTRMKMSIVAAAEVPQTTSGSTLSMRELAEATIRRFGVMPLRQQGIGQRRNSIALIRRNWAHEYRTFNDRRDQGVIDRVANERNLPGGSLIASARSNRQALTAAGCCTAMSNDIWCAPSETDYDLCPPLATLEGMVDLPTIPIAHGGIRYPVWEMIPEDWHGQVVMNSCDEPIAPDHFTTPGNEKVCIEGPCPDWQEQRLSLAYLCVRGDILRQSGYPELTERFIADAMTSHAHFMNHNYLSAIFDGSDQVPAFNVSTDGIGSTTDSVMDILAKILAWYRARYKLGTNETLEGIAPLWFRDYLKLDVARKNNRAFTSVTDFEIDEIFAAYTTRIQWVYDMEGIGVDASMPNGVPVDGRVMPGSWPSAVEMVLFPAGSWVLGQQDIITLDAMYDSTLLEQNKYTSLFFEEGFLLLNRCNRSFRIRLEGLCRNGGVAELATVTCPEPQVPPPPVPEPVVAAATTASGTDSGRTAQSARRRSSSGSDS